MLQCWMRCGAVLCLIIGVGQSAGGADVNILTVGDSLTRGNNIRGGLPRASYRPYLWQTARNYLDNMPGGDQGVAINFIGTEGNTSVTPVFPAQSAIPIDGNWDKSHQGFGGASSLSYTDLGRPHRPNSRFMGNVLDRLNKAGTVPDVALVLLGTNDLAVLGNRGSRSSFLFNRLDPLDAVGSIETVATILRDGYNSNNDPNYGGQFGDQFIVEGNPDVKVLIAALPPIDESQRYNGGGRSDLVSDVENLSPEVPTNTFVWTERDRETIIDINFNPHIFEQDLITNTGGGGPFGHPFERSVGTPSVNGAESLDADANDVIGVMNDMLVDLANDAVKDPNDNWIFVNPFEATHLVDADGGKVDVDNGGTFDMGGTGRAVWDPELYGGAGGFRTSPNPELADGLHLSFSGDQYYAGNFWDAPGGVRSVLLDAVMESAYSRGDFNADGALDAADLDLLTESVGATDLAFDLTGDDVIDGADRRFWVEELKGTSFGDADLNEVVEFADFMALSGRFGEGGGWAEGDFDGSGEVTFLDFLMLASNFSGDADSLNAAVPEPNLSVLSLAILGIALLRRRRNNAVRASC